ncbi:MAG: hemerythrin domain-containing protein [Deltaproteobacteria bacterium]|nr:hemerythrin domain-containing protein [Deltaproteobacteria bacterium]
MHRHPRLQELSREHMPALALARALRLAATQEADRPAALDRLRRAWAEELVPHFAAEEADWLPRIRDPLLRERLLADHARVRWLVATSLADAPVAAHLAELGDRLHAHVRWEERELFPYLEREVLGP